jgi:hypothetical protein
MDCSFKSLGGGEQFIEGKVFWQETTDGGNAKKEQDGSRIVADY